VVAIFIPVVLRICGNTGTAPSRLMMPLSVAALVSGMLTLVATAPNLVVNAELARHGMEGFRFFSFTPFGLPLLVLAVGAVSLALMPVANALSRAHERRADRYALKMTRNAPAFIAAMKRLAAQNLAEEEPSRLVQVLFHTHPPINARIAAARRFESSGA